MSCSFVYQFLSYTNGYCELKYVNFLSIITLIIKLHEYSLFYCHVTVISLKF